MKVLYLVATTKRTNRENLTGKTNGWKTVLNTLTVHYGDRIADHIQMKTITAAYTKFPSVTVEFAGAPSQGVYGPVPCSTLTPPNSWPCAYCQTCRVECWAGRSAPVLKGA